MGQIKKALMEWESNGHVHPIFAELIAHFQAQAQPDPQPTNSPTRETSTVYGLYGNGLLIALYQHKDAAEYDRWVSQVGEEMSQPECPTVYYVSALPMHTHRVSK